MNLTLLHLNIERNKHTDKVIKLLKETEPEIVCLAEAMHKDVKYISKELGYEYVFSPMIDLKVKNDIEQEGSAILSKFPIKDFKIYRYDDEILEKPPIHDLNDLNPQDGQRPKDRFSYINALLVTKIEKEGNEINISTTHFPVVDHTTPGHQNHELSNAQNLIDIEHSENYLDKLIKIIRNIKAPLIFTADLNSPRGEYFYDTIAEELIDQVPTNVDSTLDPLLHRVPGLKLVVDTIMTSSDIAVNNFELIENVSDHKGLMVSLNI